MFDIVKKENAINEKIVGETTQKRELLTNSLLVKRGELALKQELLLKIETQIKQELEESTKTYNKSISSLTAEVEELKIEVKELKLKKERIELLVHKLELNETIKLKEISEKIIEVKKGESISSKKELQKIQDDLLLYKEAKIFKELTKLREDVKSRKEPFQENQKKLKENLIILQNLTEEVGRYEKLLTLKTNILALKENEDKVEVIKTSKETIEKDIVSSKKTIDEINQLLLIQRTKSTTDGLKIENDKERLLLLQNETCPKCKTSFKEPDFLKESSLLESSITEDEIKLGIVKSSIISNEATIKEKEAQLKELQKEVDGKVELMTKLGVEVSRYKMLLNEPAVSPESLSEINEENLLTLKESLKKYSENTSLASALISKEENLIRNNISLISTYKAQITSEESALLKINLESDLESSFTVKRDSNLKIDEALDLELENLKELTKKETALLIKIGDVNLEDISLDDKETIGNDLITKETKIETIGSKIKLTEQLINDLVIDYNSSLKSSKEVILMLNDEIAKLELSQEELFKTFSDTLEISRRNLILLHTLSEDGIKKFILKDIIPVVNQEVEFFMGLFPTVNLNCQFNEDFKPKISRHGRDVSIKGISTGQKNIINVCIVIAITRVFLMKYKDLNVVFYDEIFASLHNTNVSLVMEMIQKFVYEGLGLKPFLVNHAHISANYFQQKINVINDGTFSSISLERNETN